MKKRSAYNNMTASDLARITRERGLEKPNVRTLSEWADVLEADDAKRRSSGAPEFKTVDAIGMISVPEDTAANLLILVGALAQRAGLDVDTPVPADDEALDLVSRLERRLAAAMPDVELMPMNTSETEHPGADGDRDAEDADPKADLLDESPAPQSKSKRPSPPKAKGE